MSDNITFCPKEECPEKECMRHTTNCKHPEWLHSVSFRVPDDCPLRKDDKKNQNGRKRPPRPIRNRT